MSTPAQAATWLQAESPNLQAAASYAAASGRHRHAMLIPAAMAGFLYAEGHWDQAIAVHQTGLAAARQAGDAPGQARALMMLSEPQFSTNDRAAAVDTSRQALALYRDLGDRAGQANALNGLGFVRRLSADYRSAAACHQQALELYHDLGDRRGQAESINRLGGVQQETGHYQAATASQQQALRM